MILLLKINRASAIAFVLLASLGFFNSNFFAQKFDYSKKDSLIFISKIEFAKRKKLNEKPINEILTAIAKSFIGTNYKAHTLENKGEEKVKINLTGFDCYTLVETSLAISRLICLGENSFDDFLKQIEILRYRSGKLNGYTSRLHYFTDWIYDLEQRGIVIDVTKELGGVPYRKTIDFMSSHSSLYDKLKDNSQNIEKIRKIEKQISSREKFYIPQDKIELSENKIKSGDIIAITTDIKGLDVSHVGIALKINGKIHLLHAPNVGKKIQITEKPLGEYVKSHSKQTGIIVVRVLPCKNASRRND